MIFAIRDDHVPSVIAMPLPASRQAEAGTAKQSSHA